MRNCLRCNVPFENGLLLCDDCFSLLEERELKAEGKKEQLKKNAKEFLEAEIRSCQNPPYTPCMDCRQRLQAEEEKKQRKANAQALIEGEILESRKFLSFWQPNEPGTKYTENKIEVFQFILNEYF